MAGVRIEKVAYAGWSNCYRVSNGTVELVATTDIGPRIMRFGFVGKENLLGELPEHLGKTGGDEWQLYGGHRLWHAPEVQPRTYYPDNFPVEAKPEGNTLHLVQPTEPTTGMQKEIDIIMDDEGGHVKLVHRLWNRCLWPVELAPWTPTVMAKEGMVIIPRAPFVSWEEKLLPEEPLVLWGYTDMSDARWKWGAKYIILKQDPKVATPQKVGLGSGQGWVAYVKGEYLFIKRFEYVEGATYPDFGCTVETYTNADIIELETLGPMVELAPGESVEHTEHWFLYKGVKVTADEDVIDAEVLPRAQAAAEMMGK